MHINFKNKRKDTHFQKAKTLEETLLSKQNTLEGVKNGQLHLQL